MQWRKQGRVYVPSGAHDWANSHAQLPTIDVVDEKTWRIYFAARDKQNRAHLAFIEVQAGSPEHITYEHGEPVLPLGAPGAFDDCGIMPACVVTVGTAKYFYYTGWTTRTTVPYHTAIGLAVSHDGGRTFERFSEGPILGPTPNEPYVTGSPFVLCENGVWRIWYFSGTKWQAFNGKYEPFYHIKYAESHDGVNWNRDGLVAIDYRDEKEAGIGRSAVIRDNDRYKMWYCHRNVQNYRSDRENSYRIGYAESPDGIRWDRRDNAAGIDVSEEGWDSEMIAYPQVVSYADKQYLFYNGNGFGRSGFGYAVRDA